MKFFIDTNILIDLITLRAPFGHHAVRLFEKARTENWTLYTTALSISTTYYVATKIEGAAKSKKLIAGILNIVEIIPADRDALMSAVSSKITDYEDAIQFHCAIKIIGLNGIVTRDLKDFKEATIPVYAPEEVL